MSKALVVALLVAAVSAQNLCMTLSRSIVFNSNCTSGVEDRFYFVATGECQSAQSLGRSSGTGSLRVRNINGTGLVMETFANVDCSGAATVQPLASDPTCLLYQDQSQPLFTIFPAGEYSVSFGLLAPGEKCAGDPCFHEDTEIQLVGESTRHKLSELRSHSRCAIPHQVLHMGVTIVADCGKSQIKTLRLTSDHLVFTQRGTVAAGNLQAGKDTLFASLDESKECSVKSVTSETKQQKYFGLNCVGGSEVLANGIKTSTFGKYHTIPALYMSTVGRLIGVERASRLGDYLASLAERVGL